MEYGSKIEEKIEIIGEFLKKYPTLILNGRRIVKYPDECKDYEILKTTIDTEFEVIKKYYEYIYQRNIRGKLSPENFNKMKELNIGGSFGYSEEVERLVSVYQISELRAVYLLRKFGTTENLFNKYRKGETLSEDDTDLLMTVTNQFFDIDLEPDVKKKAGYLNLVRSIFGNNIPQSLVLFSSKRLEEEIEKLSEYKRKIVRLRTGLEDGYCKTLEETGRILNITRERVRQIDAKAMRSLRNSCALTRIYINLHEVKDLLDLTEEERIELNKAELVLALSKDAEKVQRANELVRKLVIQENGEFKNRESIYIEKKENNSEFVKLLDTKISTLNFSIRIYNCLKRAFIVTLRDLLEYKDIRKIRNLGKKGLSEIIDKVHGLGFKFNFELEEETKEESIQTDNSTKIDIKSLSEEIEEMERRIEEKEKKSKLLDEYIKLTMKQKELKEYEAGLDAEIKQKEEILRQKGFKNGKKQGL